MRFQLISLRELFPTVEAPFELQRLTEIDEYGCFLYRCEGEMALHRHLDHDELFWALDQAIELIEMQGRRQVKAGELACVRSGWKHGSAAQGPAHVLLFSRGERSLSLNGHYDSIESHPPQIIDPLSVAGEISENEPHFLLRCNSLNAYVERISGTGPHRTLPGDALVVSLQGSIGLRCGGIVVVLQQWEMARVPAGSGWHLFGQAAVLWLTPRRTAKR